MNILTELVKSMTKFKKVLTYENDKAQRNIYLEDPTKIHLFGYGARNDEYRDASPSRVYCSQTNNPIINTKTEYQQEKIPETGKINFADSLGKAFIGYTHEKSMNDDSIYLWRNETELEEIEKTPNDLKNIKTYIKIDNSIEALNHQLIPLGENIFDIEKTQEFLKGATAFGSNYESTIHILNIENKSSTTHTLDVNSLSQTFTKCEVEFPKELPKIEGLKKAVAAENITSITTVQSIDNLISTEENDTLSGGLNNDIIDAKGGDDVVVGGPGDDQIFGGSGNDDLSTSIGNDIIHGENGDDQIITLSGRNSLDGGTGSDLILGGFQSDVIRGGAGPDLIKGDSSQLFGGSDTLMGGSGNDILMGGGGADIFVFEPNSGSDTIGSFDITEVTFDEVDGFRTSVNEADFEVGLDRVQLRNFSIVDTSNISFFINDSPNGVVLNVEATTILFFGLDRAQLSEGIFIFV